VKLNARRLIVITIIATILITEMPLNAHAKNRAFVSATSSSDPPWDDDDTTEFSLKRYLPEPITPNTPVLPLYAVILNLDQWLNTTGDAQIVAKFYKYDGTPHGRVNVLRYRFI